MIAEPIPAVPKEKPKNNPEIILTFQSKYYSVSSAELTLI